MLLVPSVSVGKLRRAFVNERCTRCPGVSARIVDVDLVRWIGRGSPPPITYIRPLKLSARVSPVARGMLAMVPMESATGSYTEGVSRIGENASRDIAAPTRVDEVADGRGGYIAEREPAGQPLLHPGVGLGVNSQIWLVACPPCDVESARI